MLRTIHLLGYLGKKYGYEHRLDVGSVGEALKALNANFKGFLKDIKKEERYNVTVGNFKEENSLNEETIQMNYRKGDIWISPSIEGKKQGVLTTVLGAVLIVVGIVLSVYGYGLGTPLIKIGAGLMIGGVAMMLTPVPGTPEYNSREKPDDRPSFLFDGPVNTNEQGGAIPIVYGRMLVGSTVVSTAIDVEDII